MKLWIRYLLFSVSIGLATASVPHHMRVTVESFPKPPETTPLMTIPPEFTVGYIDEDDAVILYDLSYSMAVVVLDSGCYEYHIHQEDVQNFLDDPELKEAYEMIILDDLSQAHDIHEISREQISHTTDEIQHACAELPIFRWG